MRKKLLALNVEMIAILKKIVRVEPWFRGHIELQVKISRIAQGVSKKYEKVFKKLNENVCIYVEKLKIYKLKKNCKM